MAKLQSDKSDADRRASEDAKKAKNGDAPKAANEASDPAALLTADHRRVEQLFEAFRKSTNAGEKAHLAEQICTELTVHTLIEEEIFYPACEDHMDQRLLDEAQVEHDGAKALVRELFEGSPNSAYFDAKVKVLADQVKHHVQEEEKPDGIIAKAKAAGIASADLAQRLASRKQELMGQAEAGTLGPPETRSFRARTKAGMGSASKEYPMARSTTMDRDRSRYDDDRRTPPRDEEGRFMSREETDDRRRSRSRYDDDDDDRRGGRGHGGWFGDPRGHAEAAREGWEERGGSRGRSRYDDDDDYRGGRGRGGEMRHERAERAPRDSRGYSEDAGRGGWFGDPEGHSEASRRGWDNPRHGESGWYGDREGHSEASRRGWDNPRHRPSGWFGDPEGHSEASRRGWDNPEHGRSGWYGDPEGHSEASRRGWDNPRHGRSGWYGDPEGHSEASRRGWDERGETRSRSRHDDDDDDDRRRRR